MFNQCLKVANNLLLEKFQAKEVTTETNNQWLKAAQKLVRQNIKLIVPSEFGEEGLVEEL